eukprot:99034-Pyramimonas_sp.AAC.1
MFGGRIELSSGQNVRKCSGRDLNSTLVERRNNGRVEPYRATARLRCAGPGEGDDPVLGPQPGRDLALPRHREPTSRSRGGGGVRGGAAPAGKRPARPLLAELRV